MNPNRAQEFVTFQVFGKPCLLPSIREAPAWTMHPEPDIIAIVQHLVPEWEDVLDLPIRDFEEFVNAWLDASYTAAATDGGAE